MSFILGIQLVTCITVFLLGFFVFYKSRETEIRWFFWLFTLGVGLWNLSLFMTISGAGHPLIWGRLAFSFGMLALIGLYLFSTVFPSPGPYKKAEVTGIVGLGSLFFVLALTDAMITQVTPIDHTYISGERTWVYGLFSIFSLFLIFASICKLSLKLKKARGVHKDQLRYVVLGIVGFLVPIVVTQLILPMSGIFRYNNLGPIFSGIMVGCLLYAMTQYRFMDIRGLIQRGVLYFMTLALLMLLYLASIFILDLTVVRRIVGLNPLLSSVIASAIIVLSFPKLKNYFHHKTDRFFFKNGYNYWDTLRRLENVLVSTIDIFELIGLLKETMTEVVKVRHARFLLLDSQGRITTLDNEELKKDRDELKGYRTTIIELVKSRSGITLCHELVHDLKYQTEQSKGREKIYQRVIAASRQLDISVIIPIVYKDKVRGILLLGEKLSGDGFFHKDIQLFEIFSRYAGVIFDNSFLYKRIQDDNLKLEEKVQTRTQQLKNLYESQSSFLANISHELQTPLAIIKINAELMDKKERLDPGLVHTILETTDQASRLVKNLLWLARADARALAFERKPVRLGSLVREVFEAEKLLAYNKNIGIRLEHVDNPLVLGDKEKLRELFLNLIGNALKYTHNNGRVKISVLSRQRKVVVSVRDTGRGISREHLPHIFKKFFRTADAKNSGIKGTGLGLTICKEIAEAHDGSIDVESAPGKGSEFTVTLPLAHKDKLVLAP